LARLSPQLVHFESDLVSHRKGRDELGIRDVILGASDSCFAGREASRERYFELGTVGQLENGGLLFDIESEATNRGNWRTVVRHHPSGS
jgi:hypothetical protein